MFCCLVLPWLQNLLHWKTGCIERNLVAAAVSTVDLFLCSDCGSCMAEEFQLVNVLPKHDDYRVFVTPQVRSHSDSLCVDVMTSRRRYGLIVRRCDDVTVQVRSTCVDLIASRGSRHKYALRVALCD